MNHSYSLYRFLCDTDSEDSASVLHDTASVLQDTVSVLQDTSRDLQYDRIDRCWSHIACITTPSEVASCLAYITIKFPHAIECQMSLFVYRSTIR